MIEGRRAETVVGSYGLCAGDSFFVTGTENQEIEQRKSTDIGEDAGNYE